MASTYLRRTPSSTGTPTKMTYSTWIKKTQVETGQSILGAALTSDASNYKCALYFNSNDKIQFEQYGTGLHFNYQTNAEYRDTNGWYHFVLQYDSTNVTAGDRIKMYVNGEEITSWATETDPGTDQVCYLGSTNNYYTDIGNSVDYGYFNGYMAQSVFIDGTALPASTFGETDSDTGEWKPKSEGQIRSAVTFGTNGFLLDYQNASYLGYDYQTTGRSTTNDFTVSGSGYKSQTNPSNNFCTWNQGYHNSTIDPGDFTYANTKVQNADNSNSRFGSQFAATKGKWYYEVEWDGSVANGGTIVGFANLDLVNINDSSSFMGSENNFIGFYIYSSNVTVYNGGGTNDYSGLSPGVGDIYGLAIDLDNGYFYLSRNGTWINSGDPTSGATGTGNVNRTGSLSYDFSGLLMGPAGGAQNSDYINCNFGDGYFEGVSAGATNADDNSQGVFKYDVPAGYYAMCTKNLREFG
jgi:hypothetical protein